MRQMILRDPSSGWRYTTVVASDGNGGVCLSAGPMGKDGKLTSVEYSECFDRDELERLLNFAKGE